MLQNLATEGWVALYIPEEVRGSLVHLLLRVSESDSGLREEASKDSSEGRLEIGPIAASLRRRRRHRKP